MRLVDAYKVDAFTTTPFTGNTAGVVPDAKGLTDREMQLIAREMNVSETAFLLPPTLESADMRLRYFTPASEIKLCGHATIATFHLLQEQGRLAAPRLKLQTNVGVVDIEARDGEVWMASDPVTTRPSPVPAARVAQLLGTDRVADPLLVKGMLFATVPSLKAMAALQPDMAAIAREAPDGLAVISFETSAPDVLTRMRFFIPSLGIPEDPVTGSAHMALAGYLLRLGRIASPATFVGEQGSEMGKPGRVRVEVGGDAADPRVRIAGRAVTVLEGKLRLP